MLFYVSESLPSLFALHTNKIMPVPTNSTNKVNETITPAATAAVLIVTLWLSPNLKLVRKLTSNVMTIS